MNTYQQRKSRTVSAPAIFDRRGPSSTVGLTAGAVDGARGIEGGLVIPRRAVVAVAGTVLSLALLFSFKTPDLSTTPGAAGSTGTSTRSTAANQSPAASGAAPSANAQTVSATKTIAGSVVSSRYGNVQVQITVSGNTITDIQAVQLPFDNPHSSQISGYAAPVLASEVLRAQSATIDTVSGATYTSDAYRQSLQSALAQVA
jgi:uncharacterized protein with FMN-binding domain